MASNCLHVNRPRGQFVSPPRRHAYFAEWRDFVPRCRYKYGVTSTSLWLIRSAQVTVAMPAPDQSVLARRDRIVAGLRAIVPGEGGIAA